MDFLKNHKVDVNPFKKSNIREDKVYNKENPSISISKSDLYEENILSFIHKLKLTTLVMNKFNNM
jgi:hypothetical protein